MSGWSGLVRITISLANIAIVIMVMLSVYPFVSGNFSVNLPDVSDIEWGFSNGNVTLVAPIEVINGGFYDITNVRFNILATNQTGAEMINAVNDWNPILAGSHTSRNIEVRIDLERLMASGFDWMIFNSDFFDVDIVLSCKYTLGLIGFRASYSLAVPWDGLITAWGFGQPSLSGNLSQGASIEVPYYIATNEHFIGYSGSYSIDLLGGGSSIAQASETISLGTNYSSSFVFDLSFDDASDLMLHDQVLTAVVTVRFSTGFEVTFEEMIDWTSPGALIP